MESQFNLEVYKALEEASNPDRKVAEQAESFFFEQHLNNPQLYEVLFHVSSNANAENNMNLKSVIILKKVIDKFFNKLNQNIQNLYVNFILTKSTTQKNHQILQIYMQILKKTLQIYEKDQDQNLFTMKIKELFQSGNFDAEKYYSLLLMVHVFMSEHQHAIKEDRFIVDNFIQEIFPFLNGIIGQLQSADNLTILAMFSHVLSKIIFRALRYSPTSLILLPEYYNVWFGFFSFILKQHNKEFLKAQKWILRSLLVFYRIIKNDDKEKTQGQIWDDWKNQYADQFFVIMLEQIFYLQNSKEYNKIATNISRSFLFYVDKDVVNKHQDKIVQIIQQKMFQLLEYNQDQKDLFYDNPVEFLKQNIWNFSDEDVRESVSFIFQLFFRQGMHDYLKQSLTERLSSLNQIESSLYLTQKLYKEIDENFTQDQNIQFFQQLTKEIILPNLQSNDDFVRMRCCAIIEVIKNKIHDQQLLKQVVEMICKCLQDNQMPVKSFAAISLGSLMKLNVVKQMLSSHLQELLKIYIDLIKKCDSESLIGSFTKIIYEYKDQIGTYAVELVQQFLEILINLFEKSSNNIDDVEHKYFSQLETFQAIKLLFKTNFDQQQLIKTFEMVDIVFQRMMQNKMLSQGFESMIEIFQELIQKNTSGQIYQPFWRYFEFFCRSIINPPQQDQYQNVLLQYIDSIDQEVDVTLILRCYAYHDRETLLNGQDEFGVKYIDLLLECVQRMDKIYSDPSLGMLVPTKVFKTDLTWILKDVNQPTVVEFIKQTLQESVKNLENQLNQEIDITDQQVNWRNLGVSLYFYPQEVYQLLQVNPQQNFVQIWKECNYHLMTSTVRLGSYLGLLQMFKLMNVGLTDIQLIEFLIMELLFIDYLKQKEDTIDLTDLLDDDYDGGEYEGEDYITKPEKLTDTQSMKQLHKYFEENFIMECEECYIDNQQMKSFLENQNFKQLVLQVYPDIMTAQNFKLFYDKLEPELKNRVETLFSNQLNQQNVQADQGHLRIRL